MEADSLFSLALRALLIALGGLALYAVLAGAYEDDEGRLQSRLENAWLRLASAQDVAIPGHTRMVQAALARMTKWLGRMFGEKVLSWRFLSVSVTLSYATAVVLSVQEASRFHTESPTVVVVGWALALALLIVAVLPTLSARWTRATVVVALAVVVLQAWDPDNRLLYSLILLWSLVADAAVVWGLRVLFGRLSTASSLVTIAFGFLGCLAAVVVIQLAPYLYFATSDPRALNPNSWKPGFLGPTEWEAGFIGLSLSMNLWTILPPLIVAGILLSLLVHRLVWPLAVRPLYLAQRLKLLEHRKLLLTAGIVLVLIGLNPDLATLSGLAGLLGLASPKAQ